MASYELFKSSIEQAEGGYQNLKKDKGNYNSRGERVGTNHGISARFYETIIGFPPSIEDMKAITKAESHLIFKNEFWDRIKGDQINSQKVAEIIADHAINAGVGAAGKVTQKTLIRSFGKKLRLDYSIGNNTVNAINSVPEERLFEKIAIARIEDYKKMEAYKEYGKIWKNRVFELARKFGVEIKKKRPS
ncbi:glycosyl hydrolase 108 family protein [Tenacibaculum maritimum]|uniref:glycosyl hydrolase 108 family protein n=1 Tax=Tenacibaculum maritimum TaxID=107401 RepID=UPI0012E4AE42|nr:glycosyl hydrolase 108 family protein [Tenacibaculum maritimum]CAA0214448.1 Predicted Peptidoglycan domain-containing protein [Tenacibaculum maritimum]CAA0251013.1 Predicted Peptidoglycan domain-containing protein [Tenacibaculum maritimum]